MSIIGQKGSGKSALAELIAYAANSWHADETGSFLNRAGRHLDGLAVELQWGDDTVSEVTLWADQGGDSEVRYLSQEFVERLCAEDQIGTELVQEIETVIFSHLDPTDTMDASSFDELRALRTEGIRQTGESLRLDIERLIREEQTLRENAAKLPGKGARIRTLTEERAGLEKQLPEATSPEEKKIQQELQARRQALSEAQRAAAVDKQNLQKLSDIRERLSVFSLEMDRFYKEIRLQLQDVGVSEDYFAAFRPTFAGDTKTPLARREMAIQRRLQKNLGESENPAEFTIRWLLKQIQLLEARQSADKARRDKVKTIQTRISEIATEIDRINKEIIQIEGPEKKRIDAAREERLDSYVAFFANLRREQKTLEELYEPVTASLHAGSASQHEQELEFSICWIADIESWLERGSVLFDQRKAIPYGTMEDLGEAACRILAPAWTSGESEQIKPAMEDFLKEFRKPENLPSSKYLRSGVTHLDVLKWLYEVQHVSLSYGLKYNGTELEKLSPGTKGLCS